MAENTALSATLGLLSHLSIDELKEVLNDDNKFEAMTKDANKSAKVIGYTEKELLIAENKSLAEYNLSKSSEFQERKRELVNVYEELKDINTRIEAKASKLKELTNKSNSDAILALLQAAVTEIERETDNIAEQFLNGDIKLDSYLEQYPNRRKLMHMRKAKLEKMTELVNRRMSYKSPSASSRSITTITPNSVRNVYPPNCSNAPVSVPYPIEPINMPMPTSYLHNHF